MKKQTAFLILIVAVFFLSVGTSQARWLNVDSGRFQTMDSYEGNEENPNSLHKYSYCANNPINLTDPSGNDFEISGLLASMNIGGLFAQISNPAQSKILAPQMKLSPRGSTAGMVERLLVAEVRLPGSPAYTFLDSEIGLHGVGAVVVNRVKSPKFPNSIEGVIKQKGQFKGFSSYPSIPQRVDNDVADLERFAGAKGVKIANYRKHLEALLDVAKRVVRLDGSLDVFVPAGGPYTPTMYFRQAGSGNPFNYGPKEIPEYRGTAGGNDFYSDR